VEEIEAPTGELLSAIAAQSAFQAASLTVEAHGRCKTC
jgi:Fe2+ or Zn2+ uptake regulation protein